LKTGRNIERFRLMALIYWITMSDILIWNYSSLWTSHNWRIWQYWYHSHPL